MNLQDLLLTYAFVGRAFSFLFFLKSGRYNSLKYIQACSLFPALNGSYIIFTALRANKRTKESHINLTHILNKYSSQNTIHTMFESCRLHANNNQEVNIAAINLKYCYFKLIKKASRYGYLSRQYAAICYSIDETKSMKSVRNRKLYK